MQSRTCGSSRVACTLALLLQHPYQQPRACHGQDACGYREPLLALP